MFFQKIRLLILYRGCALYGVAEFWFGWGELEFPSPLGKARFDFEVWCLGENCFSRGHTCSGNNVRWLLCKECVLQGEIGFPDIERVVWFWCCGSLETGAFKPGSGRFTPPKAIGQALWATIDIRQERINKFTPFGRRHPDSGL